jgi:AcrR family transcriptional regulator
MANVRTPRQAWIDAALKAVAGGGPDAVRVEALAASLGVSKGGFYWHFKDRRALLDEMLANWEKTWTEDVITEVESSSEDPREKLRRLFEIAKSGDFGIELALRDWSRRDRGVETMLRRVDNRRMDYLRSLFGQFCPSEEEVEARSMLTFSLFIGSYFIAARNPERSRSEIVQLAVDDLLRDHSARHYTCT